MGAVPVYAVSKAVRLPQSLISEVLVSRKDAITAEGVESDEVYGFLQQLGTSHEQGRLVGRPMSIEAFLETVMVTRTTYGGYGAGAALYGAARPHPVAINAHQSRFL